METLFPTFTQRLPKRKIPKKQQTSDSEAKKNEKNKPNVSKLKDTVQGWQCKTPLASGDVCKRTFFEKQHCIDHIKRDHTDGGGKICQVLVRKKKNNNSDNKKEQQQQQQNIKKEEKIEPIYKCRFCPGLYDTIDAFHEHVHSTHNLVWFAQLARKSRRRLSTATYLYHCRMCPMRTYRFGTLKSHLSAHTFHQQFRASLRCLLGGLFWFLRHFQVASPSPSQNKTTAKNRQKTNDTAVVLFLRFSRKKWQAATCPLGRGAWYKRGSSGWAVYVVFFIIIPQLHISTPEHSFWKLPHFWTTSALIYQIVFK